MSLPYPVDQMAGLQIPDPDPRPGYAPQQGYPPFGTPAVQPRYPTGPVVGYPPAHALGYPPQPGYPPTIPGYPPVQVPVYPPAQLPGYPPSQAPGYPSAPAPGYPPVQASGYPPAQAQGYPPAQPQGYPPHQAQGYPPVQAPGYSSAQQGYPINPSFPPPQQPGYPPTQQGYPPTPAVTGYPPAQPGYPAQPSYPPSAPSYPQLPAAAPGYPGSPVFDEAETNSGLNEGLLSKGGNMLNLGLKAAQKAGDMLGIFSEKSVDSGKAHHSYHYPPSPPDTPSGTSLPSYFPDLTKHLPSKANSVKVQNFRRDQDYLTLAKKCRQAGKLWEDPAFPADNRGLTDDGNNVVSYFGRRQMRANEIKWLRPKEICQAMGLREAPAMIVGERDRFDINQGEIGDCWFLAALANLADDEDSFDRVVPSGQGFGSQYCGIFRFRFFRFGEWVEVCVDDRLPTRGGQLIYLKAKDKNEFWSPLLEKAYAKLYGSFAALEGGLTIEAAVDFTGGIPEMISLSPPAMQSEALFYTMVKACQAGAFMSCSMSNSKAQRQGEQLGLQARHAYTITKVVEVRAKGGQRGTIPLIRLRNPHGNSKEWRGDWSDEDREWKNLSSSVKQSLGLTFDNDGEFYMSFNRDFLRYFGEVEIVHLTPTSMVEDQKSKIKYEVFYFHGEWKGSTAAGCGNDRVANFVRNPQYVFTLTDPDTSDDKDTCPVVLSLAQKVRERKTEHAIGFRVYQLPKGQTQLSTEHVSRSQPVGKTGQYINLREVSLRLQLPPGQYCVVPTTFRPGEEGQFLVRAFVERHWGASGQASGQAVQGGGQGGARVGVTRNVINIPIQREGGVTGVGAGAGAGTGAGGGEKRKKKRDQLTEFALGQIEKRCPKTGRFLAKLRDMYSFPADRNQETDLLKLIVDSVKK